jgi:hypothetical protein
MRELCAAASAIRACIVNTEGRVSWAGKLILLESDNVTTIAYVNRAAGNQLSLSGFVGVFARWLAGLGVSVRARHVPGECNITADSLSRGHRHLPLSCLVLAPSVFGILSARWGPFAMHVFAHPFNNHLPLFCNARSRGTCAEEAWSLCRRQARPPFLTPSPYSIEQMLAKVERDRARVVAVVPVWPAQPWWPHLFQLLVDVPLVLPESCDLWAAPTPNIPRPSMSWATIAVFLCGVASSQEGFHEQWRTSSSRGAGDVRQLDNMIVPGASGVPSNAQRAAAQRCLLSLSSSTSFSHVSIMA